MTCTSPSSAGTIIASIDSVCSTHCLCTFTGQTASSSLSMQLRSIFAPTPSRRSLYEQALVHHLDCFPLVPFAVQDWMNSIAASSSVIGYATNTVDPTRKIKRHGYHVCDFTQPPTSDSIHAIPSLQLDVTQAKKLGKTTMAYCVVSLDGYALTQL